MPEIRGQEPDPARVAQIRVEDGRGDLRGSGYRVSDIVVLTAAHVVEGASTVRGVFNADLPDEWTATANVALCEPGADVALLELDWADGLESVAPARFGRLDAGALPGRAFGFPLAGSYLGRPRGAFQADGIVRTRASQSASTLEFTVTQPQAGAHPRTFSWDGMLGAAMWCADQIVGVVSSHRTDSSDRLVAADVASWYTLDVDRRVELTGILRLPGRIDEVHTITAAEAAPHHTVSALGPGVLDAEYEQAIANSFEEPLGWATAADILRESRIVLLRAEPGSGRRTAAIRLLGASEPRSEPIHELDHQCDERDSPLFDPNVVTPGGRYLLDLSAVRGEQLTGVLHQLAPFARAVDQRSAELVVVVPALDEPAVPGLVELGRPDGGSVFKKQLDANGVDGECPDPAPPQLRAVLDHGSMTDITNLARSVRAAQGRMPAWSITDLIAQALAACSERSEQVAARIAQRSDSNFRSLLLASAALEGHPFDEVLDAQRILLRILDTDTKHEFEQAGLAHRFRAVDAEVDGDSAVRFPLLNYAEAVRQHFWTNHPALHEKLRRWVAACGSRMDWSRAVGDEFVRRFADACLGAQRPGDLLAVIESWAFGSSAQVDLAASTLAYGLGDAHNGWWFRRQCYRWASARTLPPQIAALVIPACATMIAPNHPTAAVVRLHHLSKNYDNGVAQLALSTLVSSTDEPRLFLPLLVRLTTPPHALLDIRADRDLFLAVAHPDRIRSLITEDDVQCRLVIGWDAVLADSKTDHDKHVRPWLDALAINWRDGFLDVLAKACRNKFRRAVTLRTIGDRWLLDDTSAADVERRKLVVRDLENQLYTFRR